MQVCDLVRIALQFVLRCCYGTLGCGMLLGELLVGWCGSELDLNLLKPTLGKFDRLLELRHLDKGLLISADGLDFSVQTAQLGYRMPLISGLVAEVLVAVDDHAELGSPIPKVIVGDDVVP